MPTLVRRLPLLVVGLALVGACSTAGPSTTPTASPAGSPSSPQPSSGAPGEVDYPTGAEDIVLRYDQGGSMMVEMNLSQAPIFTLYGDGTVVFRDPASQAGPGANGVLVYPLYRTAKLSVEQIQSLIAFAVTDGGLGVAKERYENPMVADAGTSFFTIAAGGRTKTVEIYGLEMSEGAPDQAMRNQFLALAERLTNLDNGGQFPTAEYEPRGYRVTLVESGGVPAKVIAWPWPDLTPKDFAPEDPDVPAFSTRAMTPEEVAAIGLGDIRGGAMGVYIKGPDGKIYSVPIRPLLPDEDK